MGHLIHQVRNTGYDCEMRSHFWLVDFDPDKSLTPVRRVAVIPDAAG